MKRGPSGTATLVISAVLALFGDGLAHGQLTVGQMQFTTVPPAGSYQVLGVVSALADVPPAILDVSKSWKEGVLRLYPSLTEQANRLAADTVVITHVVPILGQSRSYLLAFGTALRTGAGQPGPPMANEQPGAAQAPPANASGTWAGLVTAADGEKTLDVTLNLSDSPGAGALAGGLTLLGPDCEISLVEQSREGSSLVLKTKEATKLRCATYTMVTGTLTADGKLDFKLFGSDKSVPKYAGVLSRR